MKNYKTLITKYKTQLDKDPRSRAFAPLAEIYRKVGMTDEALRILKRGISFHPNFGAAIIIYGQILLEENELEEAYTTLKPQLNLNGDNLKFLKTFAQVCFHRNFILEALNTYKRVLFISPRDEEASEFVSKYDNFDSLEEEDLTQQTFDISNLDNEIESWNTLSLVPKEEPEVEEVIEEVQETNTPQFFSHTLVDLYLKQGAKQKAIEVLSSALQENPDDQKIKMRLDELQHENDASTGHDSLMAAFEASAKKLESKPKQELDKLTMAFDLFDSYIKKRSSEVLNG
ncbi:anaphase-promoting complex, cyclosome, subunit 3 [Halobacteriovorax sp. BALOs_7]|uniref:tetratricopeptide repeat protein n=1 Tax=Halobacteriovorax sp. BALOs_7 TaxID=2109558 RepID=UPI000EA1BCC6|nr:tetratricopeptide repeat protein [Halobacteriovorax sp. BALOs_7]AYF43177.1 anaphase-promoting complex, cyclosome, subunit 3 [Halobacteriovorax sp. BALOs_7]